MILVASGAASNAARDDVRQRRRLREITRRLIDDLTELGPIGLSDAATAESVVALMESADVLVEALEEPS